MRADDVDFFALDFPLELAMNISSQNAKMPECIRSAFALLRLGLRNGFPNQTDRPYFDATDTRGWNLRGDLNCLIQVHRIDQIEPRQLLFSLREGPDTLLFRTHGSRGLNRLRRL